MSVRQIPSQRTETGRTPVERPVSRTGALSPLTEPTAHERRPDPPLAPPVSDDAHTGQQPSEDASRFRDDLGCEEVELDAYHWVVVDRPERYTADVSRFLME